MASHPEGSGPEEHRLPSTASVLEPMALPSSAWTTHSDGHARGQQTRKRKSSDYPAGGDRGHFMKENVARDHARVQYGDAYDRLDMSQRAGHRFDGGQASGSARVQNGDHYQYGAVHHYNYAAMASQLLERSGDESQDRIALAMESLSFTQMDVRRASVRKAHTNTCNWLFNKLEYINWRNDDSVSDHNGFFWIKSKPGAGKSTLMKFFHHSASKQLPGDTIISFFFNARGETLERSLDGLYRGLLHQLLTAVPRLQKVLETASTANHAQYGWSLDTLKTLFSQAILELGEIKLTCFIDALDECPEAEIRDMIDFFEDLGEFAASENVQLRVCFASRLYPNVTMRRCQHMTLDGQEGHNEDIATYVKSKLKVRAGKTADGVRVALQDKAKGVFMWVVLVVRILNEQSDRGSNNAELRRCLNQIPGELHELFEDILQRGMQNNRYLIPLLQWLSFAQRPLTREELYIALRSEDPDFDVSIPWDPEEDDPETINLFILNASKGLAERTTGKKPTMQFIHESLRDYLRDTGFRGLAPRLCANLDGLSHDHLKHCCAAFTNTKILECLAAPEPLPKAKSDEAKALRKRTSELFPFLDYASKNLILHAEIAHGNNIPQSTFIARFPVDIWQKLSNITAIYDTRRHYSLVTAVGVFARFGARELIKALLDQPEHFLKISPDESAKALDEAISYGHYHVVTYLTEAFDCSTIPKMAKSTLLMQATLIEDITCLAAFSKGGLLDLEDHRELSNLLLQASKAGNVEAIRVLSDHGVNVALDGIDALVDAARSGELIAVTTLLGQSVNVNGGDSFGMNALAAACHKGYKDIVSTLLKYGAQVNGSNLGQTPLLRACIDGHSNVAQVLIENGAHVDVTHWSFRQLIVPACKVGHDLILRMIIEDRTHLDIESQQSCLDYAFRRKRKDLIQLLLDQKADVNALWTRRHTSGMSKLLSERSNPRTLMFIASFIGDADMLELLFKCGGDARISQGQEYHDALSHACSQRGHERIVSILLSKSADVPAREAEYYRKLVQMATECRSLETVKLLFKKCPGCRALDRILYTEALRIAKNLKLYEIASIIRESGVACPESDFECW